MAFPKDLHVLVSQTACGDRYKQGLVPGVIVSCVRSGYGEDNVYEVRLTVGPGPINTYVAQVYQKHIQEN